MKLAIIILASTMFAVALTPSIAGPSLYDPQTGKYLGNLSSNPYDPNSTSNPYGPYGSKYGQDSINNPYGRYGSEYSSDSPNNPYATNPPVLVVPGVRGLDY